VCQKPFRLLDALLDHLQQQHQLELTEEELCAFHAYAEARRTNPFLPSHPPQAGSSSASATGGHALSSEKRDASHSELLEAAGIAPEDAVALPPTPVEEAALQVHLRAATNITLLGEVVDVQVGYLKSTKVTQLVVRTSLTTNPVVAAESHDISTQQQQQQPSNSSSSSSECDFHVVRIVGDALKQSTEACKVGTWVTVVGQLRMNRHVDDVSRRSHAYPFVHVHAPLGTVIVCPQ
jgi:hypothetical protein